MTNFSLAKDMDLEGTRVLERITLSPSAVVWAFGDPLPGDGRSVTGEYHFLADSGARFTLYDWKQESMAWGRAFHNPIELMVGGTDLALLPAFKAWLTEQIATSSYEE